MDLSFSAEDDAFRREFVDWLDEHLPQEKRGLHCTDPAEEIALRRWWDRELFEGHWAGLAWPREYGGRGATLIQQAVAYEEMARAGAPEEMNRLGKRLLGPTLITYGTPEQKQRFLPRCLSSEDVWCEGVSEPNAGSDLAGLQTRAVRDGDTLVVTGQKVWTSWAHAADWIFALVRTNPSVPKHQGISFLLIDMHSPGVSVRPIRQINDRAEFNEVFFDEVRVPIENVVGGIDGGWPVAVTTLAHERGTLHGERYIRFKSDVADLIRLAKRVPRGNGVAFDDPWIRQRLARVHTSVELYRLLSYRILTRLSSGEEIGPSGSVVKLYWSETWVAMGELADEILGLYSQLGEQSPFAYDEGRWQYAALTSRSRTIAGGSSEIQRNIIAERVLGLPR